MSHAVVVGVDGSAQSAAAAEWAAYQAHRSGMALRMIHAGGAEPELSAAPVDQTQSLPRAVLALRGHLVEVLPGLDVSCEHVPGSPVHALIAAGEREGQLVLGSRGLGGLTGLAVGSVALRAAAHAACPVILVRAGADGQGGAPGDVVVGVDSSRPGAEVLAFAFEKAAERGANLRVLESRDLPAGGYVTAAPLDPPEITAALAAAALVRLQDTLTPWQKKFPEVSVEAEVTGWPAGKALVEASRSASLVVVGRRTPRNRPAVPGLGTVAHAVLHHTHGPVAVVPHD
ncbi:MULTISPECIES: universal stress protein [Kitasatospora]|uniref:Universal stress protein n=1 Tax=Kitasatospora cathayae TaxID=3004092 RepID=A0ABY7Q0Y8_9ACTN|nr:universal stress protein [Kitasatospora sp. HUAS 3-15]WBP86312.1 universal stress protein [Kitasatospora sp. HUAS 3-15]